MAVSGVCDGPHLRQVICLDQRTFFCNSYIFNWERSCCGETVWNMVGRRWNWCYWLREVSGFQSGNLSSGSFRRVGSMTPADQSDRMLYILTQIQRGQQFWTMPLAKPSLFYWFFSRTGFEQWPVFLAWSNTGLSGKVFYLTLSQCFLYSLRLRFIQNFTSRPNSLFSTAPAAGFST